MSFDKWLNSWLLRLCLGDLPLKIPIPKQFFEEMLRRNSNLNSPKYFLGQQFELEG